MANSFHEAGTPRLRLGWCPGNTVPAAAMSCWASANGAIAIGAQAVLCHAKGKEDALSHWVVRLKARPGHNKAVIALANSLVRIAWVIIARGERYRARPDIIWQQPVPASMVGALQAGRRPYMGSPAR